MRDEIRLGSHMPSSASAVSESSARQRVEKIRFMNCFLLNELIEFGIDALDRQPHDVEERAVDALDGGIADPLLNAVAPALSSGWKLST